MNDETASPALEEVAQIRKAKTSPVTGNLIGTGLVLHIYPQSSQNDNDQSRANALNEQVNEGLTGIDLRADLEDELG